MNTSAPLTPLARRNLTGPALRAFFAIAKKWGLTADEERRLLGMPGRSAFLRWKRQHSGRVSNDVIERISYILGIYKALHILFNDDAQADGWVKRSNAAPLFCVRIPGELTSGSG